MTSGSGPKGGDGQAGWEPCAIPAVPVLRVVIAGTWQIPLGHGWYTSERPGALRCNRNQLWEGRLSGRTGHVLSSRHLPGKPGRSSDGLQEVQLPLLLGALCQLLYGHTYIQPDMLCAGNLRNVNCVQV
ncbi:Serine protease 38 [Manis javanica]|nr:Serine protease 38 [Manis javanica]